MGHANLTNLSNVFVRQLYAKGQVSIREVADFAVQKKEFLQASEGDYKEHYMICFGLEDIVRFLLEDHEFEKKGKRVTYSPVIEHCKLTIRQEKLLRQWRNGDIDKWDNGDDGNGGDYGEFDAIRWKFAEGWRKKYPDIPVLGNVTH